jgi:hypothetical protein
MQRNPEPATSASLDQRSTTWDRVKTGSVMLALAAAVTAGAALTARHNGWGTQTHTAAVQRGAAAAVRSATALRIGHGSPQLVRPTLYLTGSVEEAARAQAALEAAVVTSHMSDAGAATVTVVPPDETVAAYQAIEYENRTRVSVDLPEITVVDLRTPSISAGADDSSLRPYGSNH